MLFALFFFICSLSFGFAVYSQEAGTAQFRIIVKKCEKPTNASRGDIVDLFASESPRTYQGKCLRSCVMESFQIMNTTGHLVPEKLERVALMLANGDPREIEIGKEIIIATKKYSYSIVSTDHCERAALMGDFMREKAKRREVKFIFVVRSCPQSLA